MSNDTTKIEITIDNHPAFLTVAVPKQVDGVKGTEDVNIFMSRALLPFFNVCSGTSLATLRARAETLGLAPHGDKTAIVARAHKAWQDAEGLFSTVGAWQNDSDSVPNVEMGKRGRPAGSANKPRETLYTIFDGSGPVTCNKAQFDVYCAEMAAGKDLARAAKAAMATH